MNILLVLLDGLLSLFELGQTTSDSTSLLLSQVGRNVFLSGVENAQLFTASMRDDGQDTGNILSDITTKILENVEDRGGM